MDEVKTTFAGKNPFKHGKQPSGIGLTIERALSGNKKLTPTQLMEATGASAEGLRLALKKQIENGKVMKVSYWLYALKDAA